LALAQQTPSEDQVKAAYLLNFAKLAEWPSRVFPESSSPLVIGISGGDDTFLAALKALVAEKASGTHPLQVKPVSSEADIKSCQMVFFRASEKKHTQAEIEGMSQAGILFCRRGRILSPPGRHDQSRQRAWQCPFRSQF
jgi:hypothetical protein